MWRECKDWVVDKCWSAFSLDEWKKKSQSWFLMFKITFMIAVLALIGVIVAFFDIHYWQQWRTSEAVMVSRKQLVEINGELYIPIKLVG